MKRLVTLAIILIATLGLSQPLVGSAFQSNSSGFFREYPLPAGWGGHPQNIVAVSTEDIYFTLPGIAAIGHLKKSSESFTKTDLTGGSMPYDIAFDGSNLWFSLPGTNQIGRMGTGASPTPAYFTVPTPNSYPTGIAVAPDGSIWVTERDGNKLARYVPGTNIWTEYPYNRPNGDLEDITVQNNDSIWFTAPGENRVGNFKPSQYPATGAFHNLLPCPPFPLPCTNPAPFGIAMGGGRPWITTPGLGRIGRYDPSTFGFWQWYVPQEAEGLAGVATSAHADGVTRTWFVARESDRAGFVNSSPGGANLGLFEAQLPFGNVEPVGIAVDTDTHAWITGYSSQSIVEWHPPYFYSIRLPYLNNP
jgi:virginiamycin B lyase